MKTPETRRAASPTRSTPAGWNGERLITAMVTGGWAAMFWFLLLSGRVSLYLGSRTSWIAPAGAVLLTIIAGGIALSARGRRDSPLRPHQVFVAAALLVPVILVTVSPPATLGSFSASRKASFSGKGLWTYWGTFDERSEIDLRFAAAAEFWPTARKLLAARAGEPVDFVGFVARNPDTGADEFLLTRFVITCCVADATIVQIRVVNVTPGEFETDDWVKVSGPIFPIGNQIIVMADSIEEIDQPRTPYLSA